MTKPTWNTLLANAITDPTVLAERLQLDQHWARQAQAACQDFALRVPEPFLLRMERGNPNDPLLLQVLPLSQELDPQPGYSTDPLQESDCNPVPGLLHKYHGRVLLTLASACSINCRYCFRRHFPYHVNNPRTDQWDAIIEYINNDSSIHEVLLSGGEPLLLKDDLLTGLYKRLANIQHVKRVRIHTRMPIAIPQRVTPEFIQAITSTRLQTLMVIHCNHAQEIDSDVIDVLQQLRHAGITLLNQSVILRGVNDDPTTLLNLCHTLIDHHVIPYYCHRLDAVQGAAHFHVSDEALKKLKIYLQHHLPGYAVPKFVVEVAGEKSKSDH